MSRYYYPVPNDTGAHLPHKIAAKEQRARDAIRELLEELPQDEAAAHVVLIDASEAAIEAKKAEELKHTIEWDKVPAEVKNIIYKYLLTQEMPIQPYIEHPQSATPKIRKFDLGANLLRCNKSIREEAEPILLGDNTFELTHYLGSYLGPSSEIRRVRERLVRKLICRSVLNAAEEFSLNRLVNLEELTVIADTKCTRAEVGHIENEWEHRSASNAVARVCDFLRDMVRVRPAINYNIIYEHCVSCP